MISYTIELKRKGKYRYKKYEVVGHSLTANNRLDLFLQDGSLTSLAPASDIDIKLTRTWLEFQKSEISKQAGQNVPIQQGG